VEDLLLEAAQSFLGLGEELIRLALIPVPESRATNYQPSILTV